MERVSQRAREAREIVWKRVQDISSEQTSAYESETVAAQVRKKKQQEEDDARERERELELRRRRIRKKYPTREMLEKESALAGSVSRGVALPCRQRFQVPRESPVMDL